MRWTTKAKIQRWVSLLPSALSYKVYYRLQRKFGGLRTISPVSRMKAGVEICKRIVKQGKHPKDKAFLEVGTGWRLNTPIALWLLGAGRIYTVDLNPYLKYELIIEDLQYIKRNEEEILEIFRDFDSFDKSRFDSLMGFDSSAPVEEFLEMCRIEYISPGDARSLYLEPKTIDFHISNNVFEHIEPSVLSEILTEGNRIIKEDGLFVHRIDYSDHFSHSDKSISAINFLQFNERQWNKYAGNRYMYMNRLRVDDFEQLFLSAGQKLVSVESDVNQNAQEILENPAFNVDGRFAGKSKQVLATTGSWIVTVTAH
ncbi:MAG: class I SAM-dependent methyltransferase [bacterium]|nr:class I SAM-dependent methyltransferase [bacterium]